MPFGFYDRGLLCVSETDRSPMGEIWACLLEKGLANVGFFLSNGTFQVFAARKDLESRAQSQVVSF